MLIGVQRALDGAHIQSPLVRECRRANVGRGAIGGEIQRLVDELPQIRPLFTDLAPWGRVAAPISNRRWKREAK